MKPPRVTLSLLDASEPLRMRAPTVDEDGKTVTDFMVIFPGLRNRLVAGGSTGQRCRARGELDPFASG